MAVILITRLAVILKFFCLKKVQNGKPRNVALFSFSARLKKLFVFQLKNVTTQISTVGARRKFAAQLLKKSISTKMEREHEKHSQHQSSKVTQ